MDARQTRWDRRKARPAAWAAAVALVLLSGLPGAAQAAERVALVIGNSAYEHTDPLRNPGNDADGMAAALGRLGFEVVLGKDLDLDGFYDTLGEFDEASRGADVTLFFYAGHGLQVQGKNWLAPVDAKLGSKLDLERGAVRLDTVLEHMRGTKKLVYLDACRNNPLAGDLARSLGVSRTAATSRGLARVRSGSGTLIGYATAPDDVAADGEGRHSPFTEALLAHIETPGLSVNDMFGEVSGAVSRATGGKQVPWSHSSLGRFYLASAAAPPPPPKDTGTSTAGGTSSFSGDAAKAAYETAERVGTVAAYRIVVEDFDGTTYARLAQAWIDKHEGKPKPVVVVSGDPEEDVTPVVPDPSPGEAARAYEAVERVNTVAAYRAFIRRFPDSYEAELARGHIAKLEEKPKPIIVAGGDPEDDVPPAAPSPKDVEARLGLSLEQRRLVQMGLAAAGHDSGPADGMFGGRTRRALRAWQASKEVEGTGYLTREQGEVLVAWGREESERRRVQAERKAREAEERRRAEAERKAKEAEERRKRARKPGTKFRDCPECPEMVVVREGRFRMGSRSGGDDEHPVHDVTIGRAFAVGVYEVTFGEWDACVSGGGCGGYRPDDEGWGRGNRPVVNVSWDDVKAYVRWLSGKTGETYRLLSEAEWEYVARSGTTTKYWWGNDIGRNRANCRVCDSRWDYEQTAPVGSFPANPFGLHDVHGNVWEWVEDCWNDSYHGAPSDGSAWESGNCSRRVLRGGSWLIVPRFLRSAIRYRYTTGYRYFTFGFRVARTLTP